MGDVTETLVKEDLPEERLARGAALDRYLVLEQLGAGGMGVVYAAWDPELNRRVAVKLVRQANTPEDESLGRSRLLREAQAIARLSHPNVISVYDVGTFRDHVFLAMELVEGATLGEWLRQTRTLKEIVGVFAQAARGLQAAHQAGMVHRDFKPDNVLVGLDGRVRVADFGLVQTAGTIEPPRRPMPMALAEKVALAETLDAGTNLLGTPLTQAGTLLGTPAYMAPEQFLNQPTDARSDQFSFCVALHQALFGERPFAGENFAEIGVEVLANRVRSSKRRVPAHLRALVRRGLRLEPQDRFPSMDALLAELERYSAQARRRILVLAGGVLLLAVASSAQWLALRRRSGLCSGAGERVASAWGPRQRAAMQAAFAATGAVFAADAFRGAAEALDRYAGEWVSARTDACEATRVRGEQSEERLDQRVSCLEDRREELRALAELFVHADLPLVMRASRAASMLDPLADCSAAALTKDGPRAPVGSEARAKVAELRHDLAPVSALSLAGHYPDAVKQIDALVGRARKLGYRPVEAETLLLKGRLQGYGGEPAAALATLEESMLAAEAGRDDRNLAHSLIELALACDGLGQTDAGVRWTRFAQAVVERLGDPPEVRAALEQVCGDLSQSAGDWQAAVDHYHEALKRLLPLPGTIGNQGAAHNNLALAYEGQGKLELALAEARQAHSIFESEVGPHHPNAAMALNNVGYYSRLLGRTAEARTLIERALAIGEAALGPDNPKLALELNNLCELARDGGRLDEAEAYCGRALKIRRKAFGEQHPQVGASLAVLASVARERNDLGRAEELYRQALAIREKTLGADHPWVMKDLVDLGEVELTKGRSAQAAPLLSRAVAGLKAPEQRPDLVWAQFLLARARGEGVRAAAESARAVLAPLGSLRQAQVAALDHFLGVR